MARTSPRAPKSSEPVTPANNAAPASGPMWWRMWGASPVTTAQAADKVSQIR